ncbi:hypothetical protein V8G54_012551 [Vigna mungo]|uniref:Uncharacterized protein n=1 Tax=Vigna mungo TaxID=3915 RepID=A0AAQ3NRE2_VIGMU
MLTILLNFLPGEFPKSLYNCSKLEYLDLSQNFFVGEIPDDIDHLAGLRFLSLGGNNFSGDIPASIGRLKELRSLQLHQCPFNGVVCVLKPHVPSYKVSIKLDPVEQIEDLLYAGIQLGRGNPRNHWKHGGIGGIGFVRKRFEWRNSQKFVHAEKSEQTIYLQEQPLWGDT